MNPTTYWIGGGSVSNRSLLIVGAGIYGAVASEIAIDMGCFTKIDFLDDNRNVTANNQKVIGTISELEKFTDLYTDVIVAIGDAKTRVSLLDKIEKNLPYRLPVLISPKSYVSPSAQVGAGSVIEPMAVVHTGVILEKGCLISAGAVVNHLAICQAGVHVDCNATVMGSAVVPGCHIVECGTVYGKQ